MIPVNSAIHPQATFEKMEGGKSVELPEPQSASSHLCAGLLPDRNYVFRLRARNASGESVGELGGPVKTIGVSPPPLPPPQPLLAFHL